MFAILMSDLIFHPLLAGGMLLLFYQLRQLTRLVKLSLHPAAG